MDKLKVRTLEYSEVDKNQYYSDCCGGKMDYYPESDFCPRCGDRAKVSEELSIIYNKQEKSYE